ncbi:hypothetical protein, partial [Streptococcus pseudopneumoniae]|uniref:hypothetical protein n=1 Tax=Streptococcus pseudopneumoniae TaxID=257758 RepID=UPI0018B09620
LEGVDEICRVMLSVRARINECGVAGYQASRQVEELSAMPEVASEAAADVSEAIKSIKVALEGLEVLPSRQNKARAASFVDH